MEILLISPIPPPYGGIATWTIQYLDWAKRNNLNVEIVNTAVIGARSNQLNSKKNYLDEVIRTFKIFSNLYKKSRKKDPNIIHINTACKKSGIIRDYLCVKIVKNKKRKIIMHYRCNIEDQVKENQVQIYFLKKISNLANLNIVLNSDSKNYLQRHTKEKITIVPNFINDNKIIKKHRNYDKEIKKILFVGHVQKMKGIMDVINVAACFPEIIFDIVGPIEINIDKFLIPSNIVFHGQMNADGIKKHLLQSDLFLLPTFTEGFSNAILEAMAVGLPIITTHVGANREMIEDRGGIIVDINNPNEIVEAINKMKNVTVREKMGRWNVLKVSENYTLNKVLLTFKKIYDNIN